MYRHVREYCKITNSEEGMEKLVERALQKQLAALELQNAEQNAKIDRLAALVELRVLGGTAVNQTGTHATAIGTQNVTNVTQSVTQVLYLRPWCEDMMYIPVELLVEVFTTSPRAAAYCALDVEKMADPEAAAPYVLEVLLEFVKRAHADPAARNVHLNPRRADQVLVYAAEAGSTWKTITLVDAIRALFDGVASGLQRAVNNNGQALRALPFGIQCAATTIPSMYWGEPDKYVAKARAPMAAHLTNTAPNPLAQVRPSEEPFRREEVPQPAREPPRAPAVLLPPAYAQPGQLHPTAPERDLQTTQAEKTFTPCKAAAVLREHRPDEPGEAPEEYVRALIRAAGVSASRLVLKLWEAAEDRLLAAEDELTARAVVSEYDFAPQRYD
jgi:hypothetical protein